jgi:hypothetical protein
MAGRLSRGRLGDSRRRSSQDFGTALKSLPLFFGHLRFKDLGHAVTAKHAW